MKITKAQLREMITEVMAEETKDPYNLTLDKIKALKSEEYLDEVRKMSSELSKMIYKYVKDKDGYLNEAPARKMLDLVGDIGVICRIMDAEAARGRR